MYLIDFFKRMARKSNIPVIIYLVLNVFIICTVVMVVLTGTETVPEWAAILIGLALYLVSLVIALSPVGEWLLRLQTGCHKIKDPQLNNFLEPIFREVYAKAKQQDPTISDNVRLFVNEDEDPNAFATGRKTVCVTQGLVRMPVDQIRATLGHEFGHLAHKDTDLLLVITVGNTIVTIFATLFKLIIGAVRIMCSFVDGDFARVVGFFMNLIFVDAFMWVWTKLGTLLVMKSSRSNEYEADEFSYRLGYGDGLCDLLESFGLSRTKGLFATLASSHPENADRIARIRNLQANANTYGNLALEDQYVNPGNTQPAYAQQQPAYNAPSQNYGGYDNGYNNAGYNSGYGNSGYGELPAAAAVPAAAAMAAAPTPMRAASAAARCASCNEELPEGATFCPFCGGQAAAPVQQRANAFCPNCGNPTNPGSTFCITCGTRLQ